MGAASLEKLATEYNITIERRPFLLRTDIGPEGIVRELRPGETGDRLGEPVGSRAEAEGLVMRRPGLTPFTMPSLEATEYAREVGMDETFFGQTMKAYWEEGADLGDMAVLESLAKSSGLDWEVLQLRLESGHYREQVLAQHREAVSLGIRGIPAFLIGNLLFTGAQPYEVFKSVIDRVLTDKASP